MSDIVERLEAWLDYGAVREVGAAPDLLEAADLLVKLERERDALRAALENINRLYIDRALEKAERQFAEYVERSESDLRYWKDRAENAERALTECAAPWSSPPTTVDGAAHYLAVEFQRRMDWARAALEAKP